ncbi:hypothetical protein V500_10864 [Pseudogymnoascus sp. VKM F-4518 (FW-2643)]|nr:hypothetical protein V500_10864 [Pseudogymnoascus sp. VKM F-4518 (FW-2643)]
MLVARGEKVRRRRETPGDKTPRRPQDWTTARTPLTALPPAISPTTLCAWHKHHALTPPAEPRGMESTWGHGRRGAWEGGGEKRGRKMRWGGWAKFTLNPKKAFYWTDELHVYGTHAHERRDATVSRQAQDVSRNGVPQERRGAPSDSICAVLSEDVRSGKSGPRRNYENGDYLQDSEERLSSKGVRVL